MFTAHQYMKTSFWPFVIFVLFVLFDSEYKVFYKSVLRVSENTMFHDTAHKLCKHCVMDMSSLHLCTFISPGHVMHVIYHMSALYRLGSYYCKLNFFCGHDVLLP